MYLDPDTDVHTLRQVASAGRCSEAVDPRVETDRRARSPHFHFQLAGFLIGLVSRSMHERAEEIAPHVDLSLEPGRARADLGVHHRAGLPKRPHALGPASGVEAVHRGLITAGCRCVPATASGIWVCMEPAVRLELTTC
jgi:hypothetical protein